MTLLRIFWLQAIYPESGIVGYADMQMLSA